MTGSLERSDPARPATDFCPRPSCQTGAMAETPNDDIKERMRLALEAKNKKSSKNTPHGTTPTEEKGQEHADRAGGKREFRRKSG